jgi:hypothetical protein
VLLEQHYETDDMVLAIAANKARLFPRFGVSKITDMMLMNEVNLTVNVGMGSSNPKERQQNFLAATGAAINLISTAPPSFNVIEGVKEIYSNAGYRDGSRFVSEQQDPRLMKAMQMVQKAKGMLDNKQMELQAQGQIEQLKIASNEKIKGAQLQVDSGRISGDLKIREAELVIEQNKLMLEKMKLEMEMQRMGHENEAKRVELAAKIQEADSKIEQSRMNMEKTRMDLQGKAMDMQGKQMEMGHDMVKMSHEREMMIQETKE